MLFPVTVLTMIVTEAAERPHVLVIVLDDFGTGQFAPMARQLELDQIDPGLLAYTDELDEPYDRQAALAAARHAMPFMDTLAGHGVLFSRAFAANSLCAPSRQAILTGSNPLRWGAYRNIDVEACGLQERSLAGRFRDVGYRTAFIGKWHVGPWDTNLLAEVEARGGTYADALDAGYEGSVREADHPLNNGFDYAFFYNRWECPYYGSRLLWEDRTFTGVQPEYNTDLFTRKAAAFLAKALDEERPFFLQLAFHTAHLPLDVDAPEAYSGRFDTGHPAINRFYTHLFAVDSAVKRLVDMLRARGVWENTILFFTSDNGATCKVGNGDLSLIPGNGIHRGHKGQYFLGGIRVPLLMTWPAGIREPARIDAAVSLMDILPTALAAAGAAIPEGIDGRSLLPLIAGETPSVHERLYFAGIHAAAWGYSGAYVYGDAQARRDLWPGAWAVVEGDYILRFVGRLDRGLEQAWPEGRPSHLALYDLADDPIEQHDLSKRDPERVERMKRDFQSFAKELPPPHRWDRRRWEELIAQGDAQMNTDRRPLQ